MKKSVKQLGSSIFKDKQGNLMYRSWLEPEPGRIFRSSAPGYVDEDGDDTQQNLTVQSSQFLRTKNITQVISLNENKLQTMQENYLRYDNIAYRHFPVRDHTPIDKDLIIQIYPLIGLNPTLIWCGYGQGRTGQFISAWEIMSGKKNKNDAIDDSTAEYDTQENVLRILPERQLFFFLSDVCTQLNAYDRTRNQGFKVITGLRRVSQESVNIVTAIDNLLQFFNLNRTNFINIPDNNEITRICTAIGQTGLAQNALRSFVEWATQEPGSDQAGLQALQQSNIAGFNTITRPAGATLQTKLREALRNFDARRFNPNTLLFQ